MYVKGLLDEATVLDLYKKTNKSMVQKRNNLLREGTVFETCRRRHSFGLFKLIKWKNKKKYTSIVQFNILWNDGCLHQKKCRGRWKIKKSSAICHINRHWNERLKKYYKGCVWKVFWRAIYLNIDKKKIKSRDMIWFVSDSN